MGRKFDLKKEARQYINGTRRGSFVTRQDKMIILERIIDDLYQSNHLPAQLRLLRKQHLHDLVDYWRKKSLKTATIQNRMSALRFLNKVAQLDLDIPSNKALNVYRKEEASSMIALEFDPVLKKIHHPVIQSIIEFQVGFGLTKLESMRLSLLNAIQDKSLFIARTIAGNKKERAIPILTDEQRTYIVHRRQLLAAHKNLVTLMSERLLCAHYEAEHRWAGVDCNTHWRQVYIRSRYQVLIQGKNHSDAINILLAETGISSKYKLAVWLAV